MDRERWGSLIWLGIGIFLCIGAYRLSLGTFRNPGPGFLPFITGAILASLAFVVFLQSRAAKKAEEKAKPFFVDKKHAWKPTLVLLGLFAYAVGMDYLGFLVSTTIFLAFLLWAVAAQRWYIVVFGSILASATSYIIFEILLNSPLPKGIFEF